MVTSAVVLEGRSITCTWSLLTLFGLAQLTATGCVRDVTKDPKAGKSDASTGTGEKGPGEEGSEEGGSTQAPDTTSASSSSPGATGPTSSAQEESSAGATTTEVEEEDTGDPEAACLKDDDDRQCVPKAPIGWFGPVGLLQATNVADTRVCKAFDAEIDELFDEVTAPQTECNGCEPWLEYPDSMFAQAVEHDNSTCSEASAKYRLEMKAGKCIKLEPDGDGKKSHWKIQLPQAEGELQCVGGATTSSKQARVKKNFFRGCQIERKGTCEAEDQVCAKRGVGPTCVFRPGEANCPAAYSARKQILYSGVEDTRGCSECKAEMKKQGSWTPNGFVTLYGHRSCEGDKKRSFKLSALEGRCDSNAAREKKGWDYIRLEVRQPTDFKGVCETKGWEPIGGVKGIDPVTVCCRGTGEGRVGR